MAGGSGWKRGAGYSRLILIFVILISGFFAGVVLSYFSFFFPQLLSENISTLKTEGSKWWYSTMGVVLSVFWALYSNPIEPVKWLSLIFELLFLYISFIDLYAKIIPNRLLILMGITGLVMALINGNSEFLIPLLCIGLVLISLQFILLSLLNKQAFGWGDVKLIIVLSIVLGWDIFWVVYFAVIIGGLFSIFGIASKKISISSRIPFAIFLLAGYLFVHFDIMRFVFMHT